MYRQIAKAQAPTPPSTFTTLSLLRACPFQVCGREQASGILAGRVLQAVAGGAVRPRLPWPSPAQGDWARAAVSSTLISCPADSPSLRASSDSLGSQRHLKAWNLPLTCWPPSTDPILQSLTSLGGPRICLQILQQILLPWAPSFLGFFSLVLQTF